CQHDLSTRRLKC
nr:Chain E, F3H meditope [synthetic construct]5EUK_F Chain F, F3H meditope [synthetic construct]